MTEKTELEPLVLDTETTGLDKHAEIVEIAIIGGVTGKIYLNTLIKPTISIPKEATKIHGINDEMVKDAPNWPEVYDNFMAIITGRKIYIYNAQFDANKIRSVCKRHKLPLPELKTSCVMLHYAYLYGDYHDYFDDYTWQKLSDAIGQQDINVTGIGASHRALADCQMTRLLANKIAKNEIITIDGFTQEQRKANEEEYKKAEAAWKIEEAKRKEKEKEEKLKRQIKYNKTRAKKAALIPENWREYPYFATSRPYGYKTLSQLRIKDLPYFEYAGECCNTYGDKGNLFKPNSLFKIADKYSNKKKFWFSVSITSIAPHENIYTFIDAETYEDVFNEKYRSRVNLREGQSEQGFIFEMLQENNLICLQPHHLIESAIEAAQENYVHWLQVEGFIERQQG